jgi:hypothetical protein
MLALNPYRSRVDIQNSPARYQRTAATSCALAAIAAVK